MTQEAGREATPAAYHEAGREVVRALRALFESGLALEGAACDEVVGLVGYFTTRTMRLYEAVLTLCESGYGVESQSLVRMLLEDLITLRYVATDPVALSVAWTRHESRRRYYYFLRARERDPDAEAPGDLEELEAQYRHDERTARVKMPKGRRPTREQVARRVAKMSWAAHSLHGQAREADRSGMYEGTEAAYDEFYPYLCEHTHGSVALARDYVTDVDGQVQVVPDQEGYKSVTPLVLATWYLHWAQRALGDLGLVGHVDVMAVAGGLADFEGGLADLERPERRRGAARRG